MARNKKEIIYHLATKYDLPLKVIEQVVDHQFKFVSKIMSKGNFDTIMLPYFGKFMVNPKRVELLNKNKENEKD